MLDHLVTRAGQMLDQCAARLVVAGSVRDAVGHGEHFGVQHARFNPTPRSAHRTRRGGRVGLAEDAGPRDENVDSRVGREARIVDLDPTVDLDLDG